MRVKSVRTVSVPPTPVYDLSVPGTQNFKLASGPFVHNSKDVADAAAGVAFGLSMRREIWAQYGVPVVVEFVRQAEAVRSKNAIRE